MKYNTNYRLEEYILNTTWNDFPSKVQQQALMCAIDLFGAVVIGTQSKQFKIGNSIVQSLGLHGKIMPIGTTNKYNLLGSSIIMGHASNSFDIDDGYRQIQGHPGTSFIAGVLGAAYQKDINIEELMSTLVVCYEATIRWALAMQKEYNFLHSTGSYGSFGTAAGIGRIFRLSPKMLNTALSIADFHAPMTPVMRSVEYPSMNKDGVPFGALTGTMAIIEALHGTTGRTHLLENDIFDQYLNDLGQKYYFLELYFKPFTCCRWAHQPIQAILDLKRKYKINWKDIDKVIVNTFKSAALLSKEVPSDTEEAQYNIAFPIACALVKNDVGFNQMNDDALGDPDILNMMKHLEFNIDGKYDEEFPAKRYASVSIILKTGQNYSSGTYEAPGEPDDSTLNLQWIIDKFYRITDQILPQECKNFIIDSFKNNPHLSVRTLIEKTNSYLRYE